MQLPRLTELDPEQMDVFNADDNGATLVIGPPGSGKTVLAFFRDVALKNKGRECQVVMFNKVLSAFSDNSEIPEVGVVSGTKTMDSWLWHWWNDSVGRTPPRQNVEGGGYAIPDYTRMAGVVAENPDRYEDLHWGHLIIDEGQDFSPKLYYLLHYCREIRFGSMSDDKRPAITVLADENQRIRDTNSTISEIRKNLNVKDTSFFHLQKNYRNSSQIAKFATEFFVGLQTGKAEPPEKEGELPKVIRVKDIDDSVSRIERYVVRNEHHEIGVIVPYKSMCEKYYNKLKHRFRNNENIRVQGYASQSRNSELRSCNLKFDDMGTITVICNASAKGLEFDAVFLPELHSYRREAGEEEKMKMLMYVMCTRARITLRLLYEDGGRFKDGVGRWIPGGESGLAAWEE